LKYRPDFSARFGSIEDARAHCQVFFRWYNTVHCHSGIGLMTPHTVHYGYADQLTEERGVTLMKRGIRHRVASQGDCDFGRSLPHRDECEFRLDAGNQSKISITMQKRHARKDSVRRYQAIIRRSWSYARPPTSRVQMGCAARCFPSVGRDHHWQLAEYPIPASESVRAIRAL
jgi:hypothetical protein